MGEHVCGEGDRARYRPSVSVPGPELSYLEDNKQGLSSV